MRWAASAHGAGGRACRAGRRPQVVPASAVRGRIGRSRRARRPRKTREIATTKTRSLRVQAKSRPKKRGWTFANASLATSYASRNRQIAELIGQQRDCGHIVFLENNATHYWLKQRLIAIGIPAGAHRDSKRRDGAEHAGPPAHRRGLYRRRCTVRCRDREPHRV